MRLTDISLRQIPFMEKGQKRVRDDVLPGFGVTVGAKTKTFFVMYGSDRRLKTLGKYPSTSLKLARQDALRYLDDPTPRNRVLSRTELNEAFLAHCEDRLRPATVRRYKFSLSKKEPVSAHDIAAFKAMYNWALRMGMVDKNPYQHLQAKFAVRDRVLTDDEVRAIWDHDRPPFSDIVKLLILTGQRRAQFGNFDQSWVHDECINFPSDVMKSRRTHTLPLTPRCSDLVSKLTSFNGWGKSKARLDKESGVTDWVIHDTRRYFSSTMAKLGVPLHITEHLLDHRSSTSGVQSVYMRYGFLPEMREALMLYDQHISTITRR